MNNAAAVAMEYANLELSLQRSEAGDYAVELRFELADGGGEAHLLESPLPRVHFDREQLRELGADPEAYGERLAAMLLADSRVREGLAKARAQAEGRKVPLRVRLRLDAGDDALHGLAWETLRDPEWGGFLFDSERVLVSRYLDSRDLAPVERRARADLTALAVFGRPDDATRFELAPVDAEGELARIEEVLSGISTTVLARARGDPPTVARTASALRDGPDLMYLVCHGTSVDGQPYLWLEREDGASEQLEGAELARRLAALGRRPPLVVLVSCQSAGRTHDGGVLAAVGPRLAAAEIGATLAMQGDLTMPTAERLLPAFFRELRRDGQIDRALAAARAEVANRPDWWAPVLFLRLRDGRLWAESLPTGGMRLVAAQRRLAALPLEAVPAPAPDLPAGSRIALRANPLFVGREAELHEIAAALEAGEVVVLAGLGGVGKTQLAVEVAHRYGPHFGGGVFWLSFADPAAIPIEVAACGGGGYLGLRPDFGDLALEEQVELVRAAWREPIPRLLVFDNCEDPELFAAWRPPSGGCRVVVTSRVGPWQPALGVRRVPLGGLERADSVALLRRHRPDLAADDPDLAAIAEELGDLALELELAGSFLARYRQAISPAAYLEQLRRGEILEHRSLRAGGFSPTGHEQQVARTFALSYERLDPAGPIDGLALKLLARAARMAPGEPIPRELLLASIELPGERDEAMLEAEDALQRLGDLGLLETAADGALRLHRLLAAFVGATAADPAAERDVERTLVGAARRLNQEGDPAAFPAVLPHLRAAVARVGGRQDERAPALCSQLGMYLYMIGDYASARTYLEQALAIRRKELGESHPNTAASLNNLGLLLQQQGHHECARPYYEQALAIFRQVLGEAHPTTANSLNNLGLLLQDQGDYEGARPYCEHTLAICEERLGHEHPRTRSVRERLSQLPDDGGGPVLPRDGPKGR